MTSLIEHPVTLSEPIVRSYFHTLGRAARRWKVLVIIAAIVVSYLILNVGLTMAAFGIEAAVRGVAFMEVVGGSLGMTPLLFAAALLSLAALLPISLLLHRLLFRTRSLGTLFSVEGRFRWRWAGQATLIAMSAGSPLILVHFGTLVLTGAVLIIAARRLGAYVP